MAVLMIEYQVPDFASWKQIFDRDPMGRKPHGVTRHWIYQDADDPNHVMLSMEFGSAEDARRFLNEPAFQQVWDRSGARQAWVLEEAEATTY
jgi:heme-degrading monooxygenase HmoA